MEAERRPLGPYCSRQPRRRTHPTSTPASRWTSSRIRWTPGTPSDVPKAGGSVDSSEGGNGDAKGYVWEGRAHHQKQSIKCAGYMLFSLPG